MPEEITQPASNTSTTPDPYRSFFPDYAHELVYFSELEMRAYARIGCRLLELLGWEEAVNERKRRSAFADVPREEAINVEMPPQPVEDGVATLINEALAPELAGAAGPITPEIILANLLVMRVGPPYVSFEHLESFGKAVEAKKAEVRAEAEDDVKAAKEALKMALAQRLSDKAEPAA